MSQENSKNKMARQIFISGALASPIMNTKKEGDGDGLVIFCEGKVAISPLKLLTGFCEAKRKRGRPVTTWRRTLVAELRTIQLLWGKARKTAQDRAKWKTLCPAMGEED